MLKSKLNIVLITLIVLLIATNGWQALRVKKLSLDLINANLKIQQDRIDILNAKSQTHYDTITVVKEAIDKGKEKKEEIKQQVQNIQSTDSLAKVYKQLRPEKDDSAGISPLDSASLKISKDETKYVINKFIDNTFLNSIQIPGLQKIIGNLNEIIAEKDSIIGINQQTIDALKSKVQDLMPGLWDQIKFWVGLTGGIVVAVLILK